MRVLVVDDSLVSARVVQGLLESLGCSVSLAHGGGEAVTACLEGAFALVLMDVRMPGLDGCAAVREIRRREAGGRRTPIVALTAAELAEERQRCLEAGMDDALVKPVGASQLATLLQRWTGAPPAPKALPAAAAPAPDADPIDLRVLDELRAYLGQRGAAERVADYLEHLDIRLRGLRAAFGAANAGEVQRLVHGLKGTSGFVGAHRLAGLCRAVEEAARNATGPAPALIDAVESEGGAVARRLRAWQQAANAGDSA